MSTALDARSSRASLALSFPRNYHADDGKGADRERRRGPRPHRRSSGRSHARVQLLLTRGMRRRHLLPGVLEKRMPN
jgi:hypothetical protein